MNKELIDKAWSTLPKEFKEEVKYKYNKTKTKKIRKECDLGFLNAHEGMFGVHNLTSDAEGEEMLTAMKWKVQEQYANYNKELKHDGLRHIEYEKAKEVVNVLYYLFGSKCLPDELNEDNFATKKPQLAEPTATRYTSNRTITTAMKNETKFLIEIADRFDDNAQEVLDFVAKNGNLEKAAKALDGARKPTASVAPSTIACHERSDLDKLPDGVYFIAGGTESEVNTKTYAKYDPSMTDAPFPTKYIGVKLGHRMVAVALEDLPGDNNGELQLMPRNHTSPKTSEHYNWDSEKDEYRFNVFEDFDGKGNTERLKEYGCTINLPEETWIPSMGELGLLMMHATNVNRAIELAGGKPIKGWHWSSTETSQLGAWLVLFFDGSTDGNNKCNSNAVRAVAAF